MDEIIRYTGNPIIDTGNAVITAICGKDRFGEVTIDDIISNLDEFLEVIKHCYEYTGATKKEKDFSRRGLKQHLFMIYTTNHYLHGINNKVEDADGKKKTVEKAEDYIRTFKDEVLAMIEGKGAYIHEEQRREEDNICKFCGRKSNIVLTKDIFPLTCGLTSRNLGVVYCCTYCYLSVIFSFASMINIRSSEDKKGMYMLYHISDERFMTEIARQQIQYLKENTMSSLETFIGDQYQVILNDINKRFPLLNYKFNNQVPKKVTVYIFLNDNREAVYRYIHIPDGACRFFQYIYGRRFDWKNISRHFTYQGDYIEFLEGDLAFADALGRPINGMDEKEVLMKYLKEVRGMEGELLATCENIAKSAIGGYRTKGTGWVETYCKKMNLIKPYEFISGLLDQNEEYFKVNGSNLFELSDVKNIVSIIRESSIIGIAFKLIKYFMYNEMDLSEVEAFVEFNKGVLNIGG